MKFGLWDNFELSDDSEQNADDESKQREPEEETTEEEVSKEEEEIDSAGAETSEYEEESEEKEQAEKPSGKDTEDSSDSEEEFSYGKLAEKFVQDGLLEFDEEKEYEDSDEGFKQIIEDTVSKKIEAKWKELPEEYRLLYDHLKAGKPLEEFSQNNQFIDYDEVDLDDEDNQKYLIAEQLREQGFSDEDIEEEVRDAEDLGKLKKKAEVAKKFLEKRDEVRRQEYEQELKSEQLRREQEIQENIKEIENQILATEEIAGFKLDKKEREQFRDYLLKPDKKTGKTQAQLNDSPERRLKLAYLDFKDFNAADVAKRAETKATRTIRLKITKPNDPMAKSKQGKALEQQREGVKVPSWFGGNKKELED
jgi:uncharacterized membrane protein